MTATTQAPAGVAPAVAARRMAALVRMELTLLRRNGAAVAWAVATPLLFAYLLAQNTHALGENAQVAAIVGSIGVCLVFGVHYHLTTVYAVRRQEHVLKLLRAGELPDAAILTGTALSGVLVFLAQTVLVCTLAVTVLGLPLPADPLLILVAIALGAAFMAALSAGLSGVTGSSEAAMLTTMPTMMLFLLTPGVMIPVGALPAWAETAGAWTPLGIATGLMRTGWTGAGQTTAETLAAIGLLLGWTLLALLLARVLFRWDPRSR